jgi:hypothetical protein
LCGQIQVLVVYNLVPDALSIGGKAVGRDASVVLGEEDGCVGLVNETALPGVTVAFLEPGAKLGNGLLKLLRLQDLVR